MTTNPILIRLYKKSKMKYLLAIALFLGSVNLFAQKETCNQLPYAKVDTKAIAKVDMSKLIEDNMIKSLEKDGSHQATFKTYIDCNGVVTQPKYERGDLDEAEQAWLLKLIAESEWTPATLGDKNVTSTVFMTVFIKNGHVRFSN